MALFTSSKEIWVWDKINTTEEKVAERKGPQVSLECKREVVN